MLPKITTYDGESDDSLGYSVAMSDDGNTIILGAYWDDIGSESDQGSAYRLHKDGATWTTNKLISYDGGAHDEFGWSVSISSNGNSWVVGAVKVHIAPNTCQGAVYWWGE